MIGQYLFTSVCYKDGSIFLHFSIKMGLISTFQYKMCSHFESTGNTHFRMEPPHMRLYCWITLITIWSIAWLLFYTRDHRSCHIVKSILSAMQGMWETQFPPNRPSTNITAQATLTWAWSLVDRYHHYVHTWLGWHPSTPALLYPPSSRTEACPQCSSSPHRPCSRWPPGRSAPLTEWRECYPGIYQCWHILKTTGTNNLYI